MMATESGVTESLKDMDIKSNNADEINWQQDKSSAQCNKHMFEHSLLTDVTFKVTNMVTRDGDTNEEPKPRVIKAHKYILMSRSPVFWNMLSGEFMEANGEIAVKDVDPDAFYHLILYLYTDEIDMKPEMVMFVLHASKKYMITKLTKVCTLYLEENLDVSNACIFLDHSIFFEEKELAKTCIRLIIGDTKNALESPTFLEVSLKALDYILASEVLSVPELEIFKAVLAWAKHACVSRGLEENGPNMRHILGSTIEKVHFPTLELKEFGTVVAPANILSVTHENKLFRYLSSVESSTSFIGPFNKPDPYPYRPRYNPDGSQEEIVFAEDPEAIQIDGNSFTFTLLLKTESRMVIRFMDLGNLVTTKIRGYNVILKLSSITGTFADKKITWKFSSFKVSDMRDFCHTIKFSGKGVVIEKGTTKINLKLFTEPCADAYGYGLKGKLCIWKNAKLSCFNKMMKFDLISENEHMPVFAIGCWPF